MVNRQRLPRGRKGGRRKADAELNARVGRLETLVKSLEANVHLDGTAQDDLGDRIIQDATFDKMESATHAKPTDLRRYLGSSFWSSLTEEVNGLRDVLDQSSDEEIEKIESSSNQEAFSELYPPAFNVVLCNANSFITPLPNGIQHPPKLMIHTLCSIYLHNVDPLCKLLHGPSLRRHLQLGEQYLHYRPGDSAVEALSFAVYYAAVNAQPEYECRQMFGEEKNALLQKYQFAVEISLAKADLINTMDISTLQAFLIYLVSRIRLFSWSILTLIRGSKIAVRNHNNSRMTWTMLGLAIRIAHALGLHLDDSTTLLQPYQTEIRRRVWQQICILDVQTAVDRGSDCVIADDSYSTPVPLNINDADLTWNKEGAIPEQVGFTDMTFALMCQDAVSLVRRLNYVARANTGLKPYGIEQDWETRQGLVLAYKQRCEDKYLPYCDMKNPFHLVTKTIANTIMLGSLLLAMRPMHKHPMMKPPQFDGILQLSTEALEAHQQLHDAAWAAPWVWYTWVPWHPLAVTIAELCIQNEGFLVERAWTAVNIAFDRCSKLIADSNTGMLWRPIEKLMNAARMHRSKAQKTPLSTVLGDLHNDNDGRNEQGILSDQIQSVSLHPMEATQGQFADLSASEALPYELYPVAFTDDAGFNVQNEAWVNNGYSQMAWTNWESFIDDYMDVGALDLTGQPLI